MSNLIKSLLITVISVFVLTGCGSITQVNYNHDYLSKGIEVNTGKVEKKLVINKLDILPITRMPDGRTTLSMTGLTIPSSLTENISSVFFKQYFNNVEISNNEGYLNFESEIIDYTFDYNEGFQPTFDLKLSVVFWKEGKEIHRQVYSKVIKTPKHVFSFKFKSAKEFAIEGLHKGLLKMYKEDITPDLLKALKENI